MQIIQLSGNDDIKWNEFVAKEPLFGLLQSWEWGEFKKELGWKVFRIAVKDDRGCIIAGAQILIKPLPSRIASMAYIPRGPIGNWLEKEVAGIFIPEIHRIVRIHNVAFLTIEPPLIYLKEIEQQIQQFGFQPSRHANQPNATIIINIDQKPEDILMQMRKKTRQYIRSAVREDITIRVGSQEDLPAYYEMMRATGHRNHFPARSREYYERQWQIFSKNNHCIILMAFLQDKLLAVRAIFCFGKHAAEFHAGSVPHNSNLHPNYLLVWEAIQWAKTQRCCSYDLWGIPTEVGNAVSEGNDPPPINRTDGLWGVYQFKSGFSKNIVSYVGAYDYVYQPRLYSLLSNRFVRGDTLDRVMTWMDSVRWK